MNLEPIDCDLVVSSENKFCLIPLQGKNHPAPLIFSAPSPLLLRLPGQKFEIHPRSTKNETFFSVGFELPNAENFGWLKDLEGKIQDLAMKNLGKIQEFAKVNFPELQKKFTLKKDDFQIFKHTNTGQSKIYAKVPVRRNGQIAPVFWRARQCGEKLKKRQVTPFFDLEQPLTTGDVILEIQHIFVSEKIKTLSCLVKEVLLWTKEKTKTCFDDYEEDSLSSSGEDDISFQ